MARMIGEETPREVSCPRCGADATWRFLDEAKTTVEIRCPDCGVFDLPRQTDDLVHVPDRIGRAVDFAQRRSGPRPAQFE
jgi:predicted RNA-binding Zn-ribbon protein involved in translation (DUF1610 family)